MTSYLNNGFDVMKYFAKFEKFIPHSIIIPSFMTIGSQMPELDWGGGFFAPPYKIGSQNTPYKLGLTANRIHSKYLTNILISRFYEQFSRNGSAMAPERLFEKISNFKNMNMSYIILKHVVWRFGMYNYFHEIF